MPRWCYPTWRVLQSDSKDHIRNTMWTCTQRHDTEPEMQSWIPNTLSMCKNSGVIYEAIHQDQTQRSHLKGNHGYDLLHLYLSILQEEACEAVWDWPCTPLGHGLSLKVMVLFHKQAGIICELLEVIICLNYQLLFEENSCCIVILLFQNVGHRQRRKLCSQPGGPSRVWPHGKYQLCHIRS